MGLFFRNPAGHPANDAGLIHFIYVQVHGSGILCYRVGRRIPYIRVVIRVLQLLHHIVARAHIQQGKGTDLIFVIVNGSLLHFNLEIIPHLLDIQFAAALILCHAHPAEHPGLICKLAKDRYLFERRLKFILFCEPALLVVFPHPVCIEDFSGEDLDVLKEDLVASVGNRRIIEADVILPARERFRVNGIIGKVPAGIGRIVIGGRLFSQGKGYRRGKGIVKGHTPHALEFGGDRILVVIAGIRAGGMDVQRLLAHNGTGCRIYRIHPEHLVRTFRSQRPPGLGPQVLCVYICIRHRAFSGNNTEKECVKVWGLRVVSKVYTHLYGVVQHLSGPRALSSAGNKIQGNITAGIEFHCLLVAKAEGNLGRGIHPVVYAEQSIGRATGSGIKGQSSIELICHRLERGLLCRFRKDSPDVVGTGKIHGQAPICFNSLVYTEFAIVINSG